MQDAERDTEIDTELLLRSQKRRKGAKANNSRWSTMSPWLSPWGPPSPLLLRLLLLASIVHTVSNAPPTRPTGVDGPDRSVRGPLSCSRSNGEQPISPSVGVPFFSKGKNVVWGRSRLSLFSFPHRFPPLSSLSRRQFRSRCPLVFYQPRPPRPRPAPPSF